MMLFDYASGMSVERPQADLQEQHSGVVPESKKRFFELVDRLTQASTQEEQSRLKEDLESITFGK